MLAPRRTYAALTVAALLAISPAGSRAPATPRSPGGPSVSGAPAHSGDGAPATPGTAAGTGRGAAAADTIDAFIRRAMEEVGIVPGMAVAVVRDGQVVLARGYGVASRETGTPADARTGFYIASSTKSFTGLAAALLAEDGVLDLDAPVGRYLPELELPGPPDEDRITLRQLLSHRDGIENTPVVIRTAYTGQHDPETLLRVLNTATTETDTAFDYSNLGYVLTSLVMQRVTGSSWQDVLAERLFRPLGMERTTAYVSRARREGWVLAQPYHGGPAAPEPLPYMKADETMHAAGGLLTTAEDLARWLAVNLQEGRVEGRRVLPAAAVREAHRQQARLDADFYRFHRFGYALGWYHSDYEGDLLLHHFGGFDGFRAHVSFMPEHGVGVAAVINETSAGFFLPDLVATFAYDYFLGKKGLDDRYDARLRDARERRDEVQEAVREDRAERATRPEEPTRAPEAYTGVYESPVLGRFTVRLEDGTLRLEAGRVRSEMEPFDEPDALRFRVGASGMVARFRFAGAPSANGEQDAGMDGRDVRAVAMSVAGHRLERTGDPPGGA